MESLSGEGNSSKVNLHSSSFQRVAEVFADLRLPRHNRDLGGYKIPGRETYYRPGDNVKDYYQQIRGAEHVQGIVPKDHHVQTSFNPEQKRYISLVNSYLVNLARGKSFVPTNEQLPSLSQRIIGNFLAQTEPRYFSLAIMDGTIDLYTAFQELYPNMMPALHAMFRLAGADGTATGAQLAKDFLKYEIEQLSFIDYSDKTIHTHGTFVIPHGDRNKSPQENKSVEFEVWCAAEAFGQAMGHESRIAANTLAQRADIATLYSKTVDEKAPFKFGRLSQILRFSDATSNKYASLLHDGEDISMTQLIRKHVDTLLEKTIATQTGNN